MVRMHYGSALGTSKEHRRSPNAPKCIGMQLGTFGERLCSPNVPNAAIIVHTDHIYGPYALYGSALGTFGDQIRSPNAPNRTPMYLGAFEERLCSSNVPKCATIVHTDHIYGPYALW